MGTVSANNEEMGTILSRLRMSYDKHSMAIAMRDPVNMNQPCRQKQSLLEMLDEAKILYATALNDLTRVNRNILPRDYEDVVAT